MNFQTLNDSNSTSKNPISAISTSVPAHAPLFTTSSLPQMGIPTSTAYSSTPNGYLPTSNGSTTNLASYTQRDSNNIHGQSLDSADRERIRSFMEGFIKQALVPFVEKQLISQNEILSSRKGIGKSFTNMRKWLSTATANQSSGTTT